MEYVYWAVGIWCACGVSAWFYLLCRIRFFKPWKSAGLLLWAMLFGPIGIVALVTSSDLKKVVDESVKNANNARKLNKILKECSK